MAGLASQDGGVERWPNDDFALGDVTAYGSGPTRYVRVEPWAGTAGSYGTAAAPEGGDLFDGYQTNDRGGAAMVPRGTSTDDMVACVVERQTEVENGEVTIWPAFNLVEGDLDGDSFRCCGVAGRVTGGTLTTPVGQDASTEYHDLPDGYYFMQLKSSSTAHRLVLWRVAAGVVTSLEDAPLSTYELTSVDLPDTGALRRMRMSIETDGATVRVRCYRRVVRNDPSNLGSTNRPNIEEVEVFSHDDTNAARVTGVGRWGVIAQVFKTQANASLTKCGVLIDKIRIRSHTGGTHYFTDQFRRFLPSAAYIISDLNSVQGKSLMSSWAGDLSGMQTAASTIHFAHLLNGSAADYVELGVDPSVVYGSSQIHGWYWWQNPTKTPTQHYSADFTFISTAGLEERRAGVHLRGSMVPDGPLKLVDLHGSVSVGGTEKAYRKGGYLAAIHYEDVSAVDTWTLEIRRYDRSQSQAATSTLVASLDLGGAGLALGTPINLAFEAQNFDANETGQGAAVGLKVTIDGTVQTPTVTTGLEDDYKTSGDWLFDMGSMALTVGPGVGVLFRPEAIVASGSLLRVDTWTEEAASTPPDVSDEDQNSVVTEWESFGATGVLLTSYSWGINETNHNPSNSQEFVSGHFSKFNRYSRNRRTWSLRLKGASEAERATMVTFFKDRLGPQVPFTWTTPEGDSIFAKLASPEQMFSLRTGAFAEGFEFRLIEVFNRRVYNEAADVTLTADTIGVFAAGSLEHRDAYIRSDGAQQTCTFSIDGVPKGTETVVFLFGGTATGGGTHYTINTPTSVALSTGTTSVSVSFTPDAQTLWFNELSITVEIDLVNSEGVSIGGLDRQYRFYLVPESTVSPPVVSWDSGTGTLPPLPGSLNVPYSLDAASQDTVSIIVEQTGGTMVVTTDYTITLPETLAAGGTTGNVAVAFTAAAAGKTLELGLKHEKDDVSEENDWTYTETLDYETGRLNSKTGGSYWCKPSNHGSAGTTVTDKYETPIAVVDSEVTKAFFSHNRSRTASSFKGLVQTKFANGSGYIRESFQVGGVDAGGFSTDGIGGTERLTELGAYQRVSVYVELFDDAESRYKNSRFVSLTVRNRGKDLNHLVRFDRLGGSGGTVTDTGRWELWDSSNLHPDDTYGVVEETHGGVNYTRLWYIHRLVDGYAYGNKKDETGDIGNFIFRPNNFTGLGQVSGGYSNKASDHIDEGLLVSGFMQERHSALVTGAPPRYRPRLSDYWEPDGGLTVDNGGAGITVTIS